MSAHMADWADHLKRNIVAARRQAAKSGRNTHRARRALASSRATLTAERERMREAANVLRCLVAHAGRADVVAQPGFLAMHARAAIRALGEAP